MHLTKVLNKAVAFLLTAALFLLTLPMQALAEEITANLPSEQTDEFIAVENEEVVQPEEQESPTKDESELNVDDIVTEDGGLVQSSAGASKEDRNDSPIVGEDLERREKNIKHFIREDKTYEAAVYPTAVHYKENGEWEDIDNTLSDGIDEEKQPILANKSNSYKVKLAKSVKSGKLVRIEKDGHEVSWSMETANNSAAKSDPKKTKANPSSNNSKKELISLSSGVQYSDIFTGIDLRYDILPEEIKESIILHEPTEISEFVFHITAKKLQVEQREDKRIYFYNPENKEDTIFVIDAPYMLDQNNTYSNQIDVNFESIEDGYTLTLRPDKAWLDDKNRVFPVVIDPIIRTSNDINNIKDAHVSQNDPNNKFGSFNILKTGTGSTSGINETYIKFAPLPTLLPSDMITDATLNVATTQSITSSYVGAYSVTADWDSAGITWNNKPLVSTSVEDYQYIIKTNEFYSWHITGVVKDWYLKGQNYGVMLKNISTTGGYTEYYSSDQVEALSGNRPFVSIFYISNAGLESYWTYNTQSAGRAGTGYVNNYNGNLVFTHQDAGIDGNRMPVSISHAYNSISSSTATNIGFGAGWRLNLTQQVFPPSGTLPYYQYVDEDGTRHYFQKNSVDGVHKDESGLGITLKVNADNTYTITDKSDNKLYFRPDGNLSSIEDNNGNKITLGYATFGVNSLLHKVTDGAGRVYTLDYNNGIISMITQPDGKAIQYLYTSNLLTGIEYPDGKRSTYTYDGRNNLVTVTNYDGYRITYDYTYSGISAAPDRISRIIESHADGTLGQEISVSYGNNNNTFSGLPGLFDTVVKTGSDIVDVAHPETENIVKALRLNAGTNVPLIRTGELSLKPNTGYLLEFDYWTDVDSNLFNVDLHPDDLPEVWPTATKNVQRYRWVIQSASANMAIAKLRFFNGFTQPNPGNIYIANLKLSEMTGGSYQLIRDGIEQKKTHYQFNNWGNTIGIHDENGNALSYRYDDITNTETDLGKQNWLKEESKLQKTITNHLSNHSGEYDGVWEFTGETGSTGSGGYSTSYRSPGNRSLSVTKTNTTSRQFLRQTLTLELGKTYTLSTSAKHFNVTNQNGKGVFIALRYLDKYGSWQEKRSDFVSGTRDWYRHEVTATIPSNASSGQVQVYAGIDGETGEAYFDSLQLEDGNTANRYNLLENADFTYGTGTPSYWTKSADSDSNDTIATTTDRRPQLDDKVFRFNGSPAKAKRLTQTIQISGSEGDVFAIAGWGNGQSVPTDESRSFGIEVKFNTEASSHKFLFHEDSTQWQYVSGKAVAQGAYSSITYSIIYEGNCNTAYFDGLQLYRESFGQSYDYDPNGNLLSVVDLMNQKTTFQYDNNNLTSMETPKGGSYTYQYDTKRNVTKAVTAENTVYSYQYDQYGNPTVLKIGETDQFIQSEAVYTPNGNYLKEVIDPRGCKVVNEYDEISGLLTGVTDPNGKTTNYVNDNMNRLTGVSKDAGGQTYTNTYDYLNDRLSRITHNGFGYNFEYDSMGNSTRVLVEDQPLITNTYESRNGRLLESTYGNGHKVGYVYDDYDRVVGKKYNDSIRFKYGYDGNGNLSWHDDLVNGIKTNYIYDFANRLVRQIFSNGNSVSYAYDLNNNISRFVQKINGMDHTTDYLYDQDNRLKELTLNNQKKITYQYDALGRLDSKTTLLPSVQYQVNYEYLAGANGSSTAMLSGITNNGNTIDYSYDPNGNIDRIVQNGLEITYEYDELNQLVRENNAVLNMTVVYTYDAGGNMKVRTEYPYTTGSLEGVALAHTVTYGYDSTWKDKLVNFDGNAITYDAIGNPLSYDGWTFTWEQGRQLESMVNSDTSISFKYNDNGIRTEKTVNGVTTRYFVVDDKVTHETDGTDNIYYTYDSSDQLVSMNYMDSEYYYIRNGQGDIIGLFDSTGAQVVTYTYDTWGKLTDIIGTMADSVGKANPYRYRGYRYDTETGLFYVGSRYYDPEVGRFINADTIDNTIENSDDLLSGNLFAYCTNNPVNHSDPDGTWKIPNWAKITIGAVALVGAVALTAATGGAMAPLLIGVAVSTLSGAAIGAATGGVKGAIDGAADGFMWGGIGALGSSAVGAVKAVKTAKKAVVIGEKMKDRVIPAAKQLNANYYKGLKGYKTIEKVAGKNIAEKLGMAHNKAWITRQMKLGTKILDIGSAGTNSANYAMERAVTSGYWNYSRVLGW